MFSHLWPALPTWSLGFWEFQSALLDSIDGVSGSGDPPSGKLQSLNWLRRQNLAICAWILHGKKMLEH